ncbi:MAG: hydroxyacid dehydrogenase [Planctomycetota bacterium]
MPGTKIALLLTSEMGERLFSDEARERLERLGKATPQARGEMLPARWTEGLLRERIAGARVAVTSWGTPVLTKAVLDAAPELGLIAHAAGSVRAVATEEVWKRGIRVTSGAAAIAVGVAETALGFMLTGVKRVWELNRATHAGKWPTALDEKGADFYDVTIGVVGASHVGRHVLKLLANFGVKALLYDPYVDAEGARELGATKADLPTLMREADVVTLHAPAIESTRGMITRELIRSMKDGALLVNTARGALLDEPALIEELSTGRIRACLDVTDPEPPPADSPLRKLENVVLTPHVAGTVGKGARRIGELAIREIERFLRGEPALHEVRAEDLARLA